MIARQDNRRRSPQVELLEGRIALGAAAPAGPNGAIVFHDFIGGILDAEGNLVFPVSGKTAVFTPGGDGSLAIHATVSNTTGHVVVWDFQNTGEPAQFFDFGFTTDWREIITPSGEATFIAHLH